MSLGEGKPKTAEKSVYNWKVMGKKKVMENKFLCVWPNYVKQEVESTLPENRIKKKL